MKMFEKVSTLMIQMKSGNKLVLQDIKDWKIKTMGNRIVSLEININETIKKEYLIISSIDLSQIEAITETN